MNCLKMLGISKGHVTRKWHAFVVYINLVHCFEVFISSEKVKLFNSFTDHDII